ncbi:hypothetical protein HMPREF3213_01253 [Heyndrickxia coagulans]|uniref:Uncharacterized protein n=1 Tax=Heyndrickxia coagulans TaxID=1398 RepID=A0A133KVH5_HEYCO|nr:hypothetical protein HMPREF3213_01253 [Heyndrickxia coagulans]
MELVLTREMQPPSASWSGGHGRKKRRAAGIGCDACRFDGYTDLKRIERDERDAISSKGAG